MMIARDVQPESCGVMNREDQRDNQNADSVLKQRPIQSMISPILVTIKRILVYIVIMNSDVKVIDISNDEVE